MSYMHGERLMKRFTLGRIGTSLPGPTTICILYGIRQASLNPHLKNPPPPADRRAPVGGTPPSGARSPEEVRRFVASLQSGWQRGRETDAADAGSADAAQTSHTPGSQAPQGEET